jgi:hypothetical protein
MAIPKAKVKVRAKRKAKKFVRFGPHAAAFSPK